MSDSLYRDTILDHYHFPRNYGTLVDFDVEGKTSNPMCGDEISLRVKFRKNLIKNIRFEHRGCVISRAAASLLSEYAKGKSREEIKILKISDAVSLLGIVLTPARLSCAALALEAVKKLV